jgi:nucleoside 2-deoxyribosyltransferase
MSQLYPSYLVYLAGPITGTSYGNCTDWRAFVEANIDRRIGALSPMRHKEYLSSEQTVADSYEKHVMSCSRGIMARDYFDSTRADILLVNLLGAARVSIGTVMEIGFAYAKRVPIVLVIEKDNIHRHSMLLQAAGFIVDNLEDGIATVERVMLPKFSDDSFSVRCSDRIALRNAE